MTTQEIPSADVDMSKLCRCGFCGRFFVGNNYITVGDLDAIDKSILDRAPLDYCPEAGYEDPNYDTERRITLDMATDAGDLSLEGQLL